MGVIVIGKAGREWTCFKVKLNYDNNQIIKKAHKIICNEVICKE